MKRKSKAKDPSAPKQTNADWLTTRDKEHHEMRQALNRQRLARSQTGAINTPAKGQGDVSRRFRGLAPSITGDEAPCPSAGIVAGSDQQQ
jgi:hypothetical protein